ncbi:hypothetical protein ACIQVC_41020 [Streptomyces sp. NPDC101112]|uniref:hypothetical protein n=1 Tax=Streptomyces sp. NPDC101112 TaxID=3366105 RepID=UPI0037FD6759
MDSLRYAVDLMRSGPESDNISLDGSGLLNWLADKSNCFAAFRHPLGFVHADLTDLVGEVPDGVRVRVHVWTEATSGDDALGLVHDHMWQLTSMVMIGQLADIAIRAVPDPQGSHDAIRVTYGKVNEFTHEGRVMLQEVYRRYVSAGQIYRIPSRSIHETLIVRAPVATLLVTQDDPPGCPGPIILAPHPAEPLGTAIREPVSPEEVSALYRAVAAIETV